MPDADPADTFAELARQLAAEPDSLSVLKRVVDASLTEIPGTEHAGITLLSNRSVSTPVSSGEIAREVDRAQYEAGEGPCLSAAVEEIPVIRVDDLTTDPRWPEFSRRAAPTGIRSMLSYQLYTDEDNIGALNLYATAAKAFDDESLHVGSLLAAHAAVATSASDTQANLRATLQSRDIIGQAKGILMERFKMSSTEAFDLLIAVSQHDHRKLRDVADELTQTGELPHVDQG